MWLVNAAIVPPLRKLFAITNRMSLRVVGATCYSTPPSSTTVVSTKDVVTFGAGTRGPVRTRSSTSWFIPFQLHFQIYIYFILIYMPRTSPPRYTTNKILFKLYPASFHRHLNLPLTKWV